MMKKLFAWFASNELALLQSKILQLQKENEELKKESHSYLEKEVIKLESELKQVRKKLQEANSFSDLKDQLRSHALFLEKFEAQEKQRTAGLQHVILWAIDADKELKFLTQGNTKEYKELRQTLERIFNAYNISGLEE